MKQTNKQKTFQQPSDLMEQKLEKSTSVIRNAIEKNHPRSRSVSL